MRLTLHPAARGPSAVRLLRRPNSDFCLHITFRTVWSRPVSSTYSRGTGRRKRRDGRVPTDVRVSAQASTDIEVQPDLSRLCERGQRRLAPQRTSTAAPVWDLQRAQGCGNCHGAWPRTSRRRAGCLRLAGRGVPYRPQRCGGRPRGFVPGVAGRRAIEGPS